MLSTTDLTLHKFLQDYWENIIFSVADSHRKNVNSVADPGKNLDADPDADS